MEDRYSLSPDVQKLIESENYSDAAKLFFDEQIRDWNQLKIAYESLSSVQTKSFWLDGYKLTAQYNPNRIKSTSAKTEDMFLPPDNCFLCEKNLPEKQKGIILPGNYTLLCNPFPVFLEHFTIPNAEHQPQQIEISFNNLLTFSKMFSKRYSLIYNGPNCGASAPFHLHFQMGTKNHMPVENDIQLMKNDYGKALVEKEDISVFAIEDKCRKIIFIESSGMELIQKAFQLIYNELKFVCAINEEPKLNIISSYNEESGWSLIIILRDKHRPDVFYKTDESKMLVSPATIDIGGILILPEEKDFEKINSETIQNIFKEVSMSDENFSKLFINLNSKFENVF